MNYKNADYATQSDIAGIYDAVSDGRDPLYSYYNDSERAARLAPVVTALLEAVGKKHRARVLINAVALDEASREQVAESPVKQATRILATHGVMSNADKALMCAFEMLGQTKPYDPVSSEVNEIQMVMAEKAVEHPDGIAQLSNIVDGFFDELPDYMQQTISSEILERKYTTPHQIGIIESHPLLIAVTVRDAKGDAHRIYDKHLIEIAESAVWTTTMTTSSAIAYTEGLTGKQLNYEDVAYNPDRRCRAVWNALLQNEIEPQFSNDSVGAHIPVAPGIDSQRDGIYNQSIAIARANIAHDRTNDMPMEKMAMMMYSTKEIRAGLETLTRNLDVSPQEVEGFSNRNEVARYLYQVAPAMLAIAEGDLAGEYVSEGARASFEKYEKDPVAMEVDADRGAALTQEFAKWMAPRLDRRAHDFTGAEANSALPTGMMALKERAALSATEFKTLEIRNDPDFPVPEAFLGRAREIVRESYALPGEKVAEHSTEIGGSINIEAEILTVRSTVMRALDDAGEFEVDYAFEEKPGRFAAGQYGDPRGEEQIYGVIAERDNKLYLVPFDGRGDKVQTTGEAREIVGIEGRHLNKAIPDGQSKSLLRNAPGIAGEFTVAPSQDRSARDGPIVVLANSWTASVDHDEMQAFNQALDKKLGLSVRHGVAHKRALSEAYGKARNGIGS